MPPVSSLRRGASWTAAVPQAQKRQSPAAVDRPGSTRRAIEHLSLTDTDRHQPTATCSSRRGPAAGRSSGSFADCVAALADAQAIGVVVPTADTIVEVADA